MSNLEYSSGTHRSILAFLLLVFVAGVIMLPDSTTGYSFLPSPVQPQLAVSVTHTPLAPKVGQLVTFNAVAHSKKRAGIFTEIYVDGNLFTSCPAPVGPNWQQTVWSCSDGMKFANRGVHTYYANTKDIASGQLVRYPIRGSKVLKVV